MSRIQSLIERINQASAGVADAAKSASNHIDSIIGSTPSDAPNKLSSAPTTLNEAVDQLDDEIRRLHREYSRLNEEATSAPGSTQLGIRR